MSVQNLRLWAGSEGIVYFTIINQLFNNATGLAFGFFIDI